MQWYVERVVLNGDERAAARAYRRHHRVESINNELCAGEAGNRAVSCAPSRQQYINHSKRAAINRRPP